MSINIFEWSITLPPYGLALDLNSTVGQNSLRTGLKSLLNQNPPLQVVATPPNLQRYVDLFAEQVTADPVADMNKYFGNLTAQGITLGGLPTGYSQLAILPSDVRPSNTAISAIGEGLVGWYMLRRGRQLLARPIAQGPDFVLRERQPGAMRVFLVEVKSTQEPGIKGPMGEAAVPRLLQYTLNAATASPGNALSCCITGVIIKSANDFDLLNLDIHIR